METTKHNLSELRAADGYFAVVEVCIPNTTLESLSFGTDETVGEGSVVWISLKGRKEPLLALALSVHKNFPKFELKPAIIHESGYVFSKRYMETLLWCANYYMCSLGEALTAFWPANLDGYLCRP